MKITVFNDTEMDWNIHSGSVKPVGSSSRIFRHTSVEFEGPDNSELFVKVWNGVVLVRFKNVKPDVSLRPSFPKAQSALFEANWRRKDSQDKHPKVTERRHRLQGTRFDAAWID